MSRFPKVSTALLIAFSLLLQACGSVPIRACRASGEDGCPPRFNGRIGL